MQRENGADDPANFILKKMGISKIPFMDLKAGLNLESSYFNNDVGCYEPLIEPWILNVQMLQKTALTSQEIELVSE